jgi:TIR domain
MSGQIFVSYRRDDSPGTTGRLFDRLRQRFTRSRIFMDIDAIEPGEDFLKKIEQAVASCEVLIAVVGTRWLRLSDGDGKSRLDNPQDFVRLEIVTALRRGIRVIPVLVDGASMPSSRDLPEEFEPLTRRQALELSHTRFNTDADRLIEAIDRALKQAKAQRDAPPQAGMESDPIEASRSSEVQSEASSKKRQTNGRTRHVPIRLILIVLCLAIILVLAIRLPPAANEVKVGAKVFLRSREGSYVIAAQAAKYNWPRPGNEGKVILTLLSNGPLRHGSVVQIQSLEQNLNGNDLLGAFTDSHDCYYWAHSYDEKKQGWIVNKLDASDPVLHYGDKIYLVNAYYDNKRLTQDSQNGVYLTIDEGVYWWWVLEKSQF